MLKRFFSEHRSRITDYLAACGLALLFVALFADLASACPTCHCFDIVDEPEGVTRGTRRRNWDTCQTARFTVHASGHNPRPTKAHRLKNRVGHKFSYYPTLHDGLIACCGCGRCVKSCPVSVDIREIVQNAVAKAKG